MQGFNMGRYVPPDLEGTVESGNKLHGKHALGQRASKLRSEGILTVRFEMPFAVWCDHCPKPTIIGQGVRFNAEKKKVGNYYSSPIFSFRMKHVVCGGVLEVRTDPQNTAYVVTEGGRKRDTGEDKVSEGQLEIMTDREREALRGNAFAKLEKTIEDREQLAQAKQRIEEIEEANSRAWEDPYEQNRRLRKQFRIERHEREAQGKMTEDLKERFSLGIDVLPAQAEDARRAALVDFEPPALRDGPNDRAIMKPLFGSATAKPSQDSKPPKKKRLKSEIAASQMRDSLVSEILGNTRLTQDPFLKDNPSAVTSRTPARIPGIKRRHANAQGVEEQGAKRQRPTPPSEAINKEPSVGVSKGVAASSALVDYDSNSS